jgi:hypothetical protein
MLRLILNLCVAAILTVVLVALMRARYARRHHEISVAEIHPDLAAGEELVHDVLDEQRRQKNAKAPQEGDSEA